ncbi:hypothetical protein Tco_0721048 [Tanacetum coccineum]
MEYLVNISKRHAFWSLNEDILKINDSDNQYAVSIKEDTAYPCLHSPKTTKETSSIRRIQRSSIRRIEDIVCEDSGRYQTWSLLQETPIRRIQSLGYAIWYDKDIHDLRSVETEFPVSFDDSDDEDYTNEFPAIVYNDGQTSKSNLLTELILSPQRIDEFDLNGETSLYEYDEEEQNVLYFNDLFPFNIIHPDDLKSEKDNDDNEIDKIQSSGEQYGVSTRMDTTYGSSTALTRIYRREVHRVQVFDFRGLPDLMAEGLSARMLMEHKDAQGADSARQIPNKGNLRDYWIGISSAGDFLGTVPSYTTIQDPILMMCHRETPRIDMYFPPNLPDVSIWAELGEIKQIVMRLFRAPDKGTSAEPPTTSTGGAS